MWSYKTNVGLQTECDPTERMWAYRPNVGLQVECGPIGRMWAYETNVGLQAEDVDLKLMNQKMKLLSEGL